MRHESTTSQRRTAVERGSVNSERNALALLVRQLRKPEESGLREQIARVLGHGEIFMDALSEQQACGAKPAQTWVAETRKSWLGARQELRQALPSNPATDRDRSTANEVRRIMAGYDRLHRTTAPDRGTARQQDQ
ncbi:MAG: hypothetical protein GEV07_11060 [Streptosporangiales bacterium]|nr:hypothetical protein [Streptosporangiales bacterium]